MINKTKKGAGADLLLEIILSSIIFFIITIIMFGLQIPKQQFHANAHVISADASVACEMSLTNLMRANSSLGINYNDWLINEFIQGNDLSKSIWKKEVEKTFNDALSDGMWDLNITWPNGTLILNSGAITKNKAEIFTCMYYAPYPAAYSQYFCFPNIPAIKDVTDGKKASFNAPDGKVECIISITSGTEETPGKLGLQTGVTNCNLDLTAKTVFEENLQPFVDNYPDINDTITLPIVVGGANYEITVAETVEGTTADVSLVKRSLTSDCSLHVILRTTNVSSQMF
jgi:hypothetical protein